MPDGSEEKRETTRIRKRFVLRAAIFGEKPLTWSYVTIHDISSSGTLFTFDRAVRIGDLMYFKIDFPDRVIECMGRARRLAGTREGKFHDVGASFEGIRPVDRDYIDEFVRKYSGG